MTRAEALRGRPKRRPGRLASSGWLALLLAAGGCAGAGAGGPGASSSGDGPGGLAFLKIAFARGGAEPVPGGEGGDGEGDGEGGGGAKGGTGAPTARPRRGGPPELKFVERSLHRRGLRFGTDGTFGSLLSYLEFRHRLVPPDQARRGDVVFFDIRGRRCADHAGVVESVDDSGRIAFRESRGGALRLSYVHPRQPSARRATDGRILNSFLRPRRPDDPPSARYFAGEMLCAVGRARR